MFEHPIKLTTWRLGVLLSIARPPSNILRHGHSWNQWALANSHTTPVTFHLTPSTTSATIPTAAPISIIFDGSKEGRNILHQHIASANRETDFAFDGFGDHERWHVGFAHSHCSCCTVEHNAYKQYIDISDT